MAALAVLGVASLSPRPAGACAACACGDPTLTAMGVEKPFKNRVRLALEERFAAHTTGDPSYQERDLRLRSALTVSWSPHGRITVAALVPLVTAWTSLADAPWKRIVGLGDAELSARALVYRDRAFSPKHLVTVLGGLKLPTAPRAYDAQGYPFPEDEQPGSGSWDPFAGLGYAWFGDDLSFFSSASYRLTTAGRGGYRHGQSLGATAGVQLQPLPVLAFALAGDLRWGDYDRFGPGLPVPNTGGFLFAISPAVMVQPVDGWILRLAAQLHVGDQLNGAQSESHAIILSTVVDVH